MDPAVESSLATLSTANEEDSEIQIENAAQTHEGISTGFDIVMAHDEEDTLDPNSDGLKRPRISSPTSKVSINDSTDASIVISVGLAQRASRG
ncbi:hypothetical protein V6N13_110510 [Hibiscus sabdariffa]